MPLLPCECVQPGNMPLTEILSNIYCADVAIYEGGGGGGTGNVTAAGTLTANQLVIGQGGTAIAVTMTAAGVLTFLGTPSSANLAAMVTGETGTGALVFANTPTLVTPVLGAATATTINGLTITTTVTGTLTLANGSSLITSGGNPITLTSTGATNVTLPTSGTLVTTTTINNATLPSSFTTLAASGAVTFSAAGAASLPAQILTGAILTGGTGTTNFPHVFIQPSGATAATTWSTAGTLYGGNAATGFAGRLIDLRLAGAERFSVSSGGNVMLEGQLNVTSGTILLGAVSSITRNTGTGLLTLNTNASGILLTPNNSLVYIGGTTSSFPAIKRNATGVDIRLADDSGYAPLTALNLTSTNNLILSKTITPAGTTGAQTIDKVSGSVNFAAAATSLVVTNALVTTSSVIQVTMATNDAAAVGLRYSPGNGSFTIRFTTGPAAETRVDFNVTN